MTLSKSEYERDRFARYGVANPEKVVSALWCQLVAGDYDMAVQFGHADYDGHWGRLNSDYTSKYREARPGPRWHWRCRYGQSTTTMPDGRTVHVAGTVEDAYDPDFCIYNDVVVTHSHGGVDVYCYPQNVFPPTDFHTATRVGSSIYLIGGLGYVDLRRPERTQVLRLDTRTFEIEPLHPGGHCPGWIYDHCARYEASDNSVTLTGGKIIGPDRETVKAFEHTVVLDLETVQWH